MEPGKKKADEDRQRWAGVFIRERRLRMAVANWNLAEEDVRHNYHFGSGPRVGASQDEHLSYMRAHSAAFERLTYEGETVLMFADAATNAVAEAILGSWGEAKRQSLRAIARGLESGRYEKHEPDLSAYTDRLWVVHLGVNLPRHVLAVHPPDGQSANAFQFGNLVYMGWTARWDPESPEWLALTHRARSETAIPEDSAGTPDRLLAWIIDYPVGLSSALREQLKAYVRKNGIFVSPVRAAAKVQSLIPEVAMRFGYRREDFFSD